MRNPIPAPAAAPASPAQGLPPPPPSCEYCTGRPDTGTKLGALNIPTCVPLASAFISFNPMARRFIISEICACLS